MGSMSPARVVVAAILILLLAADMLHRVLSDQPDLLTWYHLVTAALIVFTLLGDTITKFVVGLKGISFEQQVAAFKHDLDSINALASPG